MYERLSKLAAEGRPLEDADSALVERARQGDAGAYGDLVQRYQTVAFRTAYVVLGDATEAEDATQEAFLKAYNALGRFRIDAPFRPWLLQIVANEARNRRRAAGRRGGLVLRAASESVSGDVAPSPETAALADEDRRLLLSAVSELRDEDRLVVAYRYFFELSEVEMATALGCARGTVKSRLSRSLARLRERLSRVERREPYPEGVTRG